MRMNLISEPSTPSATFDRIAPTEALVVSKLEASMSFKNDVFFPVNERDFEMLQLGPQWCDVLGFLIFELAF